MATTVLSNGVFYRGGLSGYSSVVGNDWYDKKPLSRVGRYTFVTPSDGASRVSLKFKRKLGDGNYINLRFFIGKDPESHVKAGEDYEYTGQFEADETGSYFCADVSVFLQPNETYYLWLFPAENRYGWYNWTNDSSEFILSGGIGVMRIDLGSEIKATMCYIETEQGHKRFVPYLDKGTHWTRSK